MPGLDRAERLGRALRATHMTASLGISHITVQSESVACQQTDEDFHFGKDEGHQYGMNHDEASWPHCIVLEA